MTAPLAAQTPAGEPGLIRITGTGEAIRPPDMATITVGVVNEAATAREALAANTAAMQKALESLRAAGIAPRDLSTSGFSVQPRWVQEQNQPPRIAGATVNNTLTVRLRDLARLGEVLDRVVSLGANSVNGPVFGLQEPEIARDEARRAAARSAQARASLYAEALGLRLGRIVSVEEGEVQQPVRPMPRATMRMESAAMAVPVEAGESTITATVTVVWELAR